MSELMSVRGFLLVLCLLGGTPPCLSQLTNRPSDSNCDVTLNGEIQRVKYDVKYIKKLLVEILNKLDGLDEISEKVEAIADSTHVPAAYRNEYKVHHFASPQGSYMYSQSEAVARCQEEGMVIATPQQLQVAWQKGMDVCACGWLSDGSNRYPVQYPQRGCGGTQAGIIQCGRSKADVYCYG